MPSPTVMDPPLVTVYFKFGQSPRFAADAVADMPALTGADWTGLQTLFPGITVLPLFTVSEAALNALVGLARQRSPSFAPAPFNRMFRIVLPKTSSWQTGTPQDPLDPSRAKQLRAIMRQHLPIDEVIVQLLAAQLPVSDPTWAGGSGPPLEHLDPAPKGVGVEPVWNVTGARGQGETLTDVETNWQTNPVNLEFTDNPQPPADSTIAPTPPTPMPLIDVPGTARGGDIEDVKHGTEALSVALGRMNHYRGVGVAYETAEALLAGTTDLNEQNIADAITNALIELVSRSPGSVLMIQLEIDSGAKALTAATATALAGTYGPCEMSLPIYDVIRLAVAMQVIVVEAGGNGNKNTKQSLLLDEHRDLLLGDSGAILVGGSIWVPDANAAAGSLQGHHKKTETCTIGDRIDCFAWGDSVYTASTTQGSTTAPYLDFYNAGFDGTSSATAIIAGCALVVQSAMRQAHGSFLPPLQMRLLLRDRDPVANNTPAAVQDASGTWAERTDLIGVMPNLPQVVTQLGLLPDLYIRDNVNDDGGIHDGLLSSSPDIIVRMTPLTTSPDAAFGQGSGTEDDDDLSESPVYGGRAELYVRVRNRGGVDANQAQVKVYWGDSATLLTPPWNFIGAATIDVPATDMIVVAGPIPWDPIDAHGHDCFIATVEHPGDPFLDPTVLGNWDLFHAFIRNNNNAAWRNFDVIEFTSAAANQPMETDVKGPDDGHDDRESELRVEADLPRQARFEIELPAALAERISLPSGFKSFRDGERHGMRGRLLSHGVTRLGLVRLKRRERHRVRLFVDVPANLRGRSYEIALVQLYRGRAMGRVTWRLVPGPAP